MTAPPAAANAAPAPDEIARVLEAYLADHPGAVLSENGKRLFAMDRAKYSLSTDRGRCVLQVWNEERNLVRRVVGIKPRKGVLLLSVARFGKARPETLELSPATGARIPGEVQAERERYARLLERAVLRAWPDWKLENVRHSGDLTRSFGPAYVRAELRRGAAHMAIVAVSASESRETIDNALSAGILWLDHLREAAGKPGAADRLVSGLRVVVPPGLHALTAARMFWLDHEAAKWELYTLDEQTEELERAELDEGGNLATRLLPAPREALARERFAAEIARIREAVPSAEVQAASATELAFSLHGLVFARAFVAADPKSFERRHELTFGAGPNETPLDEESEPLFRALLARVQQSRRPDGDARDPLYRMQSEAWLVSRLRSTPEVLDESLRGSQVYSEVAAFAAEDRGMVDLLARTSAGQLSVVEVKAQEDVHLPLQGLDYWIRVRHHHLRATPSEFAAKGYFAGEALAPVEPLLVLAAPSLRVHPANAILLKYFSPRVPWLLVGLDERWRRELRATWRKRSGDSPLALHEAK